MYSLERQNKILEILKEKKIMSIEKLSEILYASGSTVRRDLNKLEQRGLVVRTFGGVILNSNPNNKEVPLLYRESQNITTKRALCQKASRLLKDNSTIFIDSSSTNLQIIPFLNDFENLTIVTNGLTIANEIITHTKHIVILPSGKVDPSTSSISGPLTYQNLSSFHFSCALLSCSAIDSKFLISESSLEQSEIKRIAARNSDRVIMLIDSSKFEKKSNFQCDIINLVNYLITDYQIDQIYQEIMQNNNIKVYKI